MTSPSAKEPPTRGTGPSQILVVSNPSDRVAICDLLAEGGYDGVDWGAGGDDTYAAYEEAEPGVVILCANLDAGDARSLAGAMRAGAGSRSVQLILIGEESGPIRTALDAADFEVDRFLGRPLSGKALLFAVRTGLEAGEPATAAPAPAPVTEVERKTAAARVERALDLAIDDFVTEAIGAIGPLVRSPGPAAEQEVDSSWEEPAAAPPREPTLILSGGGAVPAPEPEGMVDEFGSHGAVPHALPVDLTEREEDQPWERAASVTLSPVADELSSDEIVLPPHDDLDDLDDLDGDESPTAEPETEQAPPADDRPSDGAFARELRRKMSAMAERLFPGRGTGDGQLVDVGVAHGHRTEIDLASLGDETTAGTPEQAPYADLAAAETFADPRAPTGPGTSGGDETTTRRRAVQSVVEEQGSLDSRDGDVALLLGRLLQAGVTGRVTLRAPPAEKVLYLDNGRPVFATSNLPHDRMGDLLFREGKITREQYARSREILVESGRRMGEILVDRGYLKRRELLPAVKRHIEDIVYTLFAFTEGEYSVQPGETATDERIRLSKHPAALLLEGVRRKYDMGRLEHRFGSASAVCRARDSDRLKPILAVADLSRSERDVIGLLDGDNSLEAVSETTGVPLLRVYQLAFGLVGLGAAEILHRGDAGDDTELSRTPSLVGETDLAIDRQRVLAKYALVAESDYFTLLGVRRDASTFEIQRAYESARRDYAEDSFPSEVRQELEPQIGEINELLEEAFHVLQDERLRRAYLANLRD